VLRAGIPALAVVLHGVVVTRLAGKELCIYVVATHIAGLRARKVSIAAVVGIGVATAEPGRTAGDPVLVDQLDCCARDPDNAP